MREQSRTTETFTVANVPHRHLEAGQELSDRLSRCTHGKNITAHIIGLGDWWLRLLFTYDTHFEEWTEFLFLSWGEHVLPELLAEICDGELEYSIEQTITRSIRLSPESSA